MSFTFTSATGSAKTTENEQQRINEVHINFNCYGKLLKLKKLGRKIGLKKWQEKNRPKRGLILVFLHNKLLNPLKMNGIEFLKNI